MSHARLFQQKVDMYGPFHLGADVYAISDGFDAAFMIGHDLQVLYGKRIPLKMFTDSK